MNFEGLHTNFGKFLGIKPLKPQNLVKYYTDYIRITLPSVHRITEVVAPRNGSMEFGHSSLEAGMQASSKCLTRSLQLGAV